MNRTIIGAVQSLSGRHTGAFIVSDDPNIIRKSKELTDAFKLITGGSQNDNSENSKSER